MPTLLFRPLRRVATRHWVLRNSYTVWSRQLPVCWIVMFSPESWLARRFSLGNAPSWEVT